MAVVNKISKETIIRDALLLMRDSISDVSRESYYNGKGKAVATAADLDFDTEFVDRVKAIDLILDEYAEDDSDIDLISAQPLQVAKARKDQATPRIFEEDVEPYINPFTGNWVIPANPDAAGPSNSGLASSESFNAKDSDILPCSKPSKVEHIPTTAPPMWNPFKKMHSATEVNSDADFEVNTVRLSDHHPGEWLGVGGNGAGTYFEGFGSLLDEFDKYFASQTGSAQFPHVQTNENHKPQRGKIQPPPGPVTTSHPDSSLLIPIPIPIEDPIVKREDEKISLLQVLPTQAVGVKGLNVDATMRKEKKLDKQQRQDIERLKAKYRNDRAEQERSLSVAKLMQEEWNQEQNRQEMQVLQAKFEEEDNLENQSSLAFAKRLQDDWSREDTLQELQTLQEEFNRRDEQEIQRQRAEIERIQAEWNRAEDEKLRRDQELAKQIALEEEKKTLADVLHKMRTWQDYFQSADDNKLAEDQKLAFQLQQEDQEAYNRKTALLQNLDDESVQSTPWPQPPGSWPPNPPTSNLLSYNSSGVTQPTPLIPQANPSSNASPRSTRSNHQTETRVTPTQRSMSPLIPTRAPADNAAVSDGLAAARKLQAQWQAEHDKNLAAAQQAQKEIEKADREVRAQADRLRNQQEQERLEHERRRHEEARRKREEEAARAARMVECAVCAESFEPEQVCRLGCGHSYCRDCITQSIQHALKKRQFFQCCKKRVITPSASLTAFVRSDSLAAYTSLCTELGTVNPTYCSGRSCSIFIPTTAIRADIGVCPKCGVRTCVLCKQAAHQGVCKADLAGQKLLALGNQKKWQQCPHCKNMVEKSEGCLHMSCICGTQFCYNCGRLYSQCDGSSCRRR